MSRPSARPATGWRRRSAPRSACWLPSGARFWLCAALLALAILLPLVPLPGVYFPVG